jgi:gamma-glutamyl:cysteine ligase YbdK (ATP-grasp superfamily)
VAGRHVHVGMPDAETAIRAHEVLLDALTEVRPHLDELDAQASLARLPELIRAAGGAGRQRGLYAIGGMDSLLRELAPRARDLSGRDCRVRQLAHRLRRSTQQA